MKYIVPWSRKISALVSGKEWKTDLFRRGSRHPVLRIFESILISNIFDRILQRSVEFLHVFFLPTSTFQQWKVALNDLLMDDHGVTLFYYFTGNLPIKDKKNVLRLFNRSCTEGLLNERQDDKIDWWFNKHLIDFSTCCRNSAEILQNSAEFCRIFLHVVERCSQSILYDFEILLATYNNQYFLFILLISIESSFWLHSVTTRIVFDKINTLSLFVVVVVPTGIGWNQYFN